MSIQLCLSFLTSPQLHFTALELAFALLKACKAFMATSVDFEMLLQFFGGAQSNRLLTGLTMKWTRHDNNKAKQLL